MKIRKFLIGALVGFILIAPLTGILYLANQVIGLPFVPFDLFDWMTRILPGSLITFGIDMMIDIMRFLGLSVADTAKTAERFFAILQFLGIGAVIGGVFYSILAARKTEPDRTSGLVIGALFGLPMTGITVAINQGPVHPALSLVWVLFLFLIWGVLFRNGFVKLEHGPSAPIEIPEDAGPAPIRAEVERISRRQFLIRLGTAAASITVLSGGVGAAIARSVRKQAELALDDTMAHQAEGTSRDPFPNAGDPVTPAPGTRPEYTPIKDHYKVFLRTEPTVIERAGWILPITGLVEYPLMLTLDDIVNDFESRDQYVTLSCISGRVGTTLISTTQWTGVSMQDILAAAGLKDNARYLHITSGDGFYETVDLNLIRSDERIMLCYAWDGNTLPVDHGFPVRIWIPDRYGMKQPKWITAMEVTDEYIEGYWVERNWDRDAIVKTTSVIDTVAVDALFQRRGETMVPIGGIAFSGDKQIAQVEVRVDGGPWETAELRSSLSETTWAIWRYDWPFEAGDHTFEVRCVEGNGTPQIEEVQKNRPSGATGLHSFDATLEG